jgi:transcriptional regulator with XRE-family HTH domain
MAKPLASYSVGVRLRQAREKRNVSQRQLADMTDIGATTINQIEKGKVEPRGSTIEKLAIALDVDPCWLLYGSGTKPKWNEKAERAE